MTRFVKHWQSLPNGNRIGGTLALVALIATLIALVGRISDLVAGDYDPEPTSAPAAVSALHAGVFDKTPAAVPLTPP